MLQGDYHKLNIQTYAIIVEAKTNVSFIKELQSVQMSSSYLERFGPGREGSKDRCHLVSNIVDNVVHVLAQILQIQTKYFCFKSFHLLLALNAL